MSEQDEQTVRDGWIGMPGDITRRYGYGAGVSFPDGLPFIRVDTLFQMAALAADEADRAKLDFHMSGNAPEDLLRRAVWLATKRALGEVFHVATTFDSFDAFESPAKTFDEYETGLQESVGMVVRDCATEWRRHLADLNLTEKTG